MTDYNLIRRAMLVVAMRNQRDRDPSFSRESLLQQAVDDLWDAIPADLYVRREPRRWYQRMGRALDYVVMRFAESVVFIGGLSLMKLLFDDTPPTTVFEYIVTALPPLIAFFLARGFFLGVLRAWRSR